MNYPRQLYTQLRSGISRNRMAFYGSCVMFIITAFFINADHIADNLFIKLILSVFIAIIFSVALKTFIYKYSFFRVHGLVQKILSVCCAVICFVLLNDIDNIYSIMGYVGIMVSLTAVALYFHFTVKNENTLTPYLLKNLILACFVGLIFFGGITLCIYAVNYLIYEFSYDVIGKLIITVFAFAFEVLTLNIFLSGLPNDGEELHIPKAFKILVLYVAFPIYLLLIAVLYVYLAKILVTTQMPGGQINLFASFSTLFFVFFRFTIIQYDYPITRIFSRFGGLLMLPVLVAQTVAVYIRLAAYGLTSARYLSVVLNITAIIFVALSLIKKGRYIRQIIIIIIAAALLICATPLNLIDVPVYEQTFRLDRVLTKNKMFTDGNIIPNANISDEDKAIIRSCYNYLISYEKAPYYIRNVKGKAFIDLFGFDRGMGNYGNEIQYFNYNSMSSEFDISGHSRLAEINESNHTPGSRLHITVDNTQYDLTDFFLILSQDDINGDNNPPLIYNPADNITLIFKHVDFSVNHENIFQYYYISGFALIK